MSKTIYSIYPKIQHTRYNIFELYRKKTAYHIRWTTITTKNNIFSTVFSKKSNKTITKSSGSIGITTKRTSNIVYRYLIKLFSLFISKHNTTIDIIFRNQLVKKKKKIILQNILLTKLEIANIYGFLTRPHGGTKLSKKRRL